jgi:hypothetical protein
MKGILVLILIAIVGLGVSIELNPKLLPAEHLSIEGFVRAVEINRSHTLFGTDIIIIGFEDGRVKFFKGSSLPDIVKQGSNNRIYYLRTHRGDGTFCDKIEGLVQFPESKQNN